MATERKSLLTQGLEPLAKHSPKISDLLQRLYALDDDLQDAHFLAKRDDEFGEDVVQKYKTFLAFRQILIDELEQQKVPVPWQMRMRIDDIELTLRQREEKKTEQNGTSSKKKKEKSSTTTTSSAPKKKSREETSADVPVASAVASTQTLGLGSLLVPTLLALVGALLWYQWFS